ncbi:MAG: rhodanese-like domain-containing protein, partial [Actinobacteria bacterium]|nr:rhodanese-like domain-containing protein [Actinomycetota bacterium]
VYCKSGNMSADAVADLAALGYTDVVELDGGFDAWVDAGRGLLNS